MTGSGFLSLATEWKSLTTIYVLVRDHFLYSNNSFFMTGSDILCYSKTQNTIASTKFSDCRGTVGKTFSFVLRTNDGLIIIIFLFLPIFPNGFARRGFNISLWYLVRLIAHTRRWPGSPCETVLFLVTELSAPTPKTLLADKLRNRNRYSKSEVCKV